MDDGEDRGLDVERTEVPPLRAPGWYPRSGRMRWWDGTAWRDTGPGRRLEPLQALAGPALVVQGLVGLSMVLTGAQSIVGSEHLEVLRRLGADPASVTFEQFDHTRDRYAALGVAQGIVFWLAVVASMVWLHRVYVNLGGVLRSRRLGFTPAWAVGWWFVPFANLVQPQRIMSVARAASSPEHQADSSAWRSERRSVLVSTWWALYLGSVLLASFGGLFVDAESARAAEAARIEITRWSSALHLAAGACFLLIVRKVTRDQRRRRGRLAAR